MDFIIHICVAVIVIMVLMYFFKRPRLTIPGPAHYMPFVGIERQLLTPNTKFFLYLSKLVDKYGPVLQFRLNGQTYVLVSDYKSIHEVAVEKGMDFAGREMFYRTRLCISGTGIIYAQPDATWKALRKLSHRHIKQFGSGMVGLESIIKEVADDMFRQFHENEGKPWDPKIVIFSAVLSSMLHILTGKKIEPVEEFIPKFRKLARLLPSITTPAVPFRYRILDYFHWLRWFPIEIVKLINSFVKLEAEIWTRLSGHQKDRVTPKESLIQALASLADDPDSLIQPLDATKTCMMVLLAGVYTTNHSVYGAVNILAHHPEIQDKIWAEIQQTCTDGEVHLKDRPTMPFSRAFILELLRYTSVAPISISHCSTKGTTIQGYQIPKDTAVYLNLWRLHHDPDFWGNPEVFLPERFLQDDGEMVPPDHPHRLHLMPFGAGPRVCVGETLALSRMFLWITNFVSRFRVLPASDNDRSLIDPRNFVYTGLLEPCLYKIVVSCRKVENESVIYEEG